MTADERDSRDSGNYTFTGCSAQRLIAVLQTADIVYAAQSTSTNWDGVPSTGRHNCILYSISCKQRLRLSSCVPEAFMYSVREAVC